MDRERKNMKEALAPPESKGSDEDNDNDQVFTKAPKLMS